MTTIVWDGKTIAADGQGTSAAMVTDRNIVKIHTPESLNIVCNFVKYIAVAGTCGDESIILDVIRTKGFPEVQTSFHEEMSFWAAVFLKTGKVVMMVKQKGEKIASVYTQSEPFAIGSGRDYAHAGLAMGLDSVECVRLAAKLDIYTNHNVTSVDFDPENVI